LLTSIKSIKFQNYELQLKQQSHFDWYANNSKQSYWDYEHTSFWLAADQIAFQSWRNEIQERKWLLDVGCAQGRSTFKVMDLDIHILGLDISKKLVRQAIDRYRKGNYKAKASFIAADASSLPLIDESMDYILVYGVLHHLPYPDKMCNDITRVLKPGGIYFGSENNASSFRRIFDLLQKLKPIWSEEAGPEALISKNKLLEWFNGKSI
jgi:ubiquinone/menaquinone biosynthesis C-methylase UbiE